MFVHCLGLEYSQVVQLQLELDTPLVYHHERILSSEIIGVVRVDDCELALLETCQKRQG